MKTQEIPRYRGGDQAHPLERPTTGRGEPVPDWRIEPERMQAKRPTPLPKILRDQATPFAHHPGCTAAFHSTDVCGPFRPGLRHPANDRVIR